VGIENHNKSKEWRIMNGVAEPMRMHQLWLSPESYELHDEMTAYKGPSPKAKDNRLDGLAIALAVSKRPVRSADIAKDVKLWEQRKMRRYDKETGVQL
jgi:hypothetical protein